MAEEAAESLAAIAPGRRIPRTLPPTIRDAVRRLRAHLAGRPDPLTDIPLDLSGMTPFARRVARVLRRVPPGRTIACAEVARRMASPRAAGAVKRVLGRNPLPLLVPGHRVGGTGAAERFDEHLLLLEGVVSDADLAAAYAHLGRTDRRLAALVRRFGPYAPGFGGGGSGHLSWNLLVTSIIHQQLSLKAAGTIAGRVRALTPGDDLPTPRQLRRLDDDALRGSGLSRAKVASMRDLAARILDGRLDCDALEHLDDVAVIAELVQVRGIGVWTAQMLLIFHLDRRDVWPVGDLGLRNAVAAHLRLPATPDEHEMERLGERYAPYRSVAAWYLWALADGEVI